MAKEHTGHEAAREGEAETVRTLAEVIATQIEEQRELAAGLGNISGDFDLAVTYKEVEYVLHVEAPAKDAENGTWVVTLDKKKGTEEDNLLTFEFNDKDNWTIGGGLPTAVTIGSVTINKLHVSLTRGNPLLVIIPVDQDQ